MINGATMTRRQVIRWATTLGVVLLIVSSSTFALGYYFADATWKRTSALNSAVSIDHALRVIEYSRTGRLSAQKDLLDVQMEGNLSTFIEQQRYLGDDANLKQSTARILGALKAYWAKDPPFTSPDWQKMRQDPVWLGIRERNEAYLERLVGK